MCLEHSQADDDSPYPEVRSAVANTDDPDMPVGTFRAWVIGLLWSIILPGMNQFSSSNIYLSGSLVYVFFSLFFVVILSLVVYRSRRNYYPTPSVGYWPMPFPSTRFSASPLTRARSR